TECQPVGDATAPGDPTVARCITGGLDIAAELVREGWALALLSGGYSDAEATARTQARGVWRSAFVPPADYRAHIAATEEYYRNILPETVASTLTRALHDGPAGPSPFTGTALVRRETAEGLVTRQL